MADLIWRSLAVEHLDEIAGNLRNTAGMAGERYFIALYQACLSLREFPERGRRHDERFRVFVFRNHLVFYRYERASDRVVFVAIFDARRNVAELVEHLAESDQPY